MDAGECALVNTIVSGNTAATGPDIQGTVTLTEGGNLIGDATGATGLGDPGTDYFTGDPRLAPLGDYGGPTQTMPPLPGSPAIDAAIGCTATTDQRGFARLNGSAPDIGAVESQGRADLALFWPADWDGDGKSFGVERALGTDPLQSDPSATGNLTAPVFAASQASLTFSVNPAAEPDTIWILQRSPDLAAENWTEVYRFDGPTNLETPLTGFEASSTATSITVTDESPLPGKAFYRFAAELATP